MSDPNTGDLSRDVSRASRALVVTAAVGAIATGVAVATTLGTAYLLARAVVTPSRRKNYDQRVLAVDAAHDTITLADTPDARAEGRYGLWWNGDRGYAVIGEVLTRVPGRITRRIEAVRYGDIRGARHARIGSFLYLGADELGLAVRPVSIPTALGDAPAWYFPASSSAQSASQGAVNPRWAIHVHGRGATRHEALRAVPVFDRAGWDSLVISYRNDGEAPPSDDGKYALGGTEWLDVESALAFAIEHGAEEIVIMGWSMGGAMTLQTVTRSPFVSHVRGIVLESPVVDWVDTLHFQAEQRHLPESFTQAVLNVIGSEAGPFFTGQSTAMDFPSMDFVARANELSVPTLILHSDDDGFVPSTASRALALARPDVVTLEPWKAAAHTRLWNVDPERWQSEIARWLAALVETDADRR